MTADVTCASVPHHCPQHHARPQAQPTPPPPPPPPSASVYLSPTPTPLGAASPPTSMSWTTYSPCTLEGEWITRSRGVEVRETTSPWIAARTEARVCLRLGREAAVQREITDEDLDDEADVTTTGEGATTTCALPISRARHPVVTAPPTTS